MFKERVKENEATGSFLAPKPPVHFTSLCALYFLLAALFVLFLAKFSPLLFLSPSWSYQQKGMACSCP